MPNFYLFVFNYKFKLHLNQFRNPTFNNCPTLFKYVSALFSTMEYSQSYRQQLIEQELILNPLNVKIYIMKTQNPTPNSKEDNCWSDDSCSDTDVAMQNEISNHAFACKVTSTQTHLFAIPEMAKILRCSIIFTANFHGWNKIKIGLTVTRYSEILLSQQKKLKEVSRKDREWTRRVNLSFEY